jgi:hypothetical protein
MLGNNRLLRRVRKIPITTTTTTGAAVPSFALGGWVELWHCIDGFLSWEGY